MSRVSRSSTLVLLAMVGAAALGPPAASASDANLRTLVAKQAASDKKADKVKITEPNSRSPQAFNRFYRRYANLAEKSEKTVDRFRTAFAHEVAETAEAERGRILVLRGLRDESNALGDIGHAFRRAASRMLKYRYSQRGLRSAQRRLAREVTKASKIGTRGDERVKSGAKAIKAAPAPTSPAA
ncbi:hypothetical protein [Patulibacter minatonensis]|uniref:hypothetical protein n=1 Tax=Patulibacter minatonensis TaxID=298163 RepID=UPI00047A0525|nr:hypothetical protein [Patulibacter minatonensis]